jgi:hypothetical protein
MSADAVFAKTPMGRANRIVSELWGEDWIGRSYSFPQGFPRDVEARIAAEISSAITDALVAQGIEQPSSKRKVAGSIPAERAIAGEIQPQGSDR